MNTPTADAASTAADLWQRFLEWLPEAGGNLLQIFFIVLGCLLAAWLLKLVIRRVVKRIVEGAKNKANVDDTQAIQRSPLADVRVVQRTRTLGTILQGIVNVSMFFVALILIVQTLNEGILGSLTLLTAAIGAGLGFGAQNIVRDVLNGIFIVAGDQIGIGDVVDLGLATGVVEYVSVRVTHVRDVNGTLWYVRNGEILRIGNMSMGWSRLIVDTSVPLDANLDVAEEQMMEIATNLMKDPKWRSRIVERPEMWGLESVGGESQLIRLVVRTRAGAKDDVAQELRKRLAQGLSDAGVAVTAMTSTMLEGATDAQRVRGANPPKTKPTPVAPINAKPTWRARKAKSAKSAEPEKPTTKPLPTAPKQPKQQPKTAPLDPPQDGTL